MDNNVQDDCGCADCATDPIGRLQQMFVDMVQRQRIRHGEQPALRAAFTKPHGVAYGKFIVHDKLPNHLRIGVFGGTEYPIWVRFSSDNPPNVPDLRSTLGVAIKLFGVGGKKVLGDGDTQDFLFQNMSVFYVDNARDVCELTQASVVDDDFDGYLKRHPKTAKIIKAMAKVETSVLTTTYWSAIPYRFGSTEYVKYKLEPYGSPTEGPTEGSDYLARDLAQRLRTREQRFRFMVQLRKDAEKMPLDKGTVKWSEKLSPPIHVADVILPVQDITELGQPEYGENLSYNIAHCLPAHAPIGSIAEARVAVYQASAALRHYANGIQYTEPGEPRTSIPPRIADQRVVRAAIHPSIGIARVGNSKKGWFVGPEYRHQPLQESYRDHKGALLRQAARFRIYGLNAYGEPVKELTPANSDITWHAHLANKKSAWYQFQLALDIPEAAHAPASNLRNADISKRKHLVIDPGPRSLHPTVDGEPQIAKFNTGKFMKKRVDLGWMTTDTSGRLIVLGGRGKSASYDGNHAYTFANNDGWHDDISDGPVHADVVHEGRSLRVDPAWVLVAPPNYAPGVQSIRTMWDLMRDVAVQASMLPRPVRPSFQNDIRPLLERMTNLQWVNAGFAASFGWRGPFNFTSEEWLSRLSDPTPASQEMRRIIFENFRSFDRDSWSPQPWPWLYGDATSIPPAKTPRQHVELTKLQMQLLEQWAEGDFDQDFEPASANSSIDELPIQLQPDELDRAALENCLADAFHPGCEMTWPMRHASMYSGAFRIKHAERGHREFAYGEALDSGILDLPAGPLASQFPGGLTRWMAVPWQTDTASCRSGYDPDYDPYLPTFWPARSPNQVLTHEAYATVMDASLPLQDRQDAFASRTTWLRPLGSRSLIDQVNNFVKRFGRMGVIEFRPGPTDADFPPWIGVETFADLEEEDMLAFIAALDERADEIDVTEHPKMNRFPRGLPGHHEQ